MGFKLLCFLYMDEIRVALYDPEKLPWDDIRDSIIGLEQEAFGENSFTKEEMTQDFEDKKNVIVLIFSRDELIGFTYAKPDTDSLDIAWMWDAVIKKEYRGRHLIGTMMALLEEDLRKRNIKFLDRMARIENNYAANIEKAYGDRILKKEGPTDSKWGPQMYFRIRL
jgi:ribosomal protein S18 acetylase RimI-like enzyme